ncbi:vegetative cell wall protein gp1-like [Orussus abietinus]|uniref:vegetative cell wall protein gp1-like n=1 Tax=Orussus abietinus TaxID=222816 RepID=UPI0006259C1D|nr:vegetative cell wall protein gp1-like [Orussus abietinus]
MYLPQAPPPPRPPATYLPPAPPVIPSTNYGHPQGTIVTISPPIVLPVAIAAAAASAGVGQTSTPTSYVHTRVTFSPGFDQTQGFPSSGPVGCDSGCSAPATQPSGNGYPAPAPPPPSNGYPAPAPPPPSNGYPSPAPAAPLNYNYPSPAPPAAGYPSPAPPIPAMPSYNYETRKRENATKWDRRTENTTTAVVFVYIPPLPPARTAAKPKRKLCTSYEVRTTSSTSTIHGSSHGPNTSVLQLCNRGTDRSIEEFAF